MEGLVLLAVVWQPIASPLQIGAGACVLALLAVFAYIRVFREGARAALGLLVMRLVAISAVVTLLLGPSRDLAQAPSSERPRLTVLVDTSESMLTGDCEGDSRLDYLTRTVLPPDRLQALQSQFDVDLQGFDSDLRPLTSQRLYGRPGELATGRSTHLADGVLRTLRQFAGGGDGEAVLLLSDGRDTNDASPLPAATLARSQGVPIYAVGVGGARSAVDAALLAIPLQDTLLPNEPGGLLVKVYQSGLEGSESTLVWKSGAETHRQPVKFDTGQVLEVQLPIQQSESGQYEYQVSLESLPEEQEHSNNTQTVFVEVLPRRLRVLLLEGLPNWDSKFLAQSLRKDEQIELTQVTQVASKKRETIVTRRDASAPRIPQTLEDWSLYDVVLLGNGLEHLLDAKSASTLVQYLSDGGGHVVFARGPAWDHESPEGRELSGVLGVIEPVRWTPGEQSPDSISLTAAGRTGGWLSTPGGGPDVPRALQRLPGFEPLTSLPHEKGGTLVLARNDATPSPDPPAPAIVRMPYGRGEVVGILGAGLWRWSLLPPELQDLRGFYDTFWSNLIRWLALGGDFAPGAQVTIQLSRTSVRLGDELSIDVAYRIMPPAGVHQQLTLIDPDGATIPLALHSLPGATPRYRTTYRPTSDGIYQVQLQTPGLTPSELSRRFNVYEVNLERLQSSANFGALQMLAEQSGGALLDPSQAGDLLQELRRHREASLAPPQREYLWDHGALMTLLLVWAGAEWLLRRAAGLW